MKILITGASSGIGREMARQLAPKCDKIVLAARNTERLEALKKELAQSCADVEVFSGPLDEPETCYRLHEAHPDVDFLINNAGFGDFAPFIEGDLDKELSMIDTNVKALHILTKLYVKDMAARDEGRILNVASLAAFAPGPLMATYYATKAYVLRLSEAIRTELKKSGSKVKISLLCPGPVKTNFRKTANVGCDSGEADCRKVVAYALKRLDRYYIVPMFSARAGKFFLRLLPSRMAAASVYKLQSKRWRVE